MFMLLIGLRVVVMCVLLAAGVPLLYLGIPNRFCKRQITAKCECHEFHCFAVLDSINAAWRTMRDQSLSHAHSCSARYRVAQPLSARGKHTHAPIGQREPQTHAYNNAQFGAVLNLSTPTQNYCYLNA